MSDLRWIRSSRCPDGHHCVEAARVGDRVLLRNSTRPDAILGVPLDQWRRFVLGLGDTLPEDE
ncbi:DUF397 domain-containing protein [Actinoplanes regularis]|uniref:DUF397 domain-containing protein n=1 Tax=Actinoplanes regularis TaxID=52697 RepID=UPI000B792E8B|nr:DUF397 domain-containing protein [Actinoplanes regularis]GIE88581.1 hypothetical protein Are01nite_50610 [Actinoplanes regularis]